MNRRFFLKGLLLLPVAPAVVRAESLMKIAAPYHYLYGDGAHDDTAALQAWIDGGRVIDVRTGKRQGFMLIGGRYRITDTITLREGRRVRIHGASFTMEKRGEGAPIFYVPAPGGIISDCSLYARGAA